MKNILLILCSILAIACNSPKKTTTNGSGQTKVKKEGRKIYGTVAAEYLTAGVNGKKAGAVSKPKLSFNIDGEYFYIKIMNPEISEQSLKALVGENIEVRGKLVGEGFSGEIPTSNAPAKENASAVAKEIGHILIFELVKE